MVPQTNKAIDKTKLYGLLHELDGTSIKRQVRILKVGMGVPTGPDVHVWIDRENNWCVETGHYISDNGRQKRQPKIDRFPTREEAFKAYVAARRAAPQRNYPRKVPYFTFLRMAADGNFAHDFDAIEEHGPTPTEIDIVFLTNEPFESRFAWYTAAELKCEGNGLNARRRLALADGDEERRLADEAEAQGEKFFPITNGCYAKGCPYARETAGNGNQKPSPPVCKPHGRLYFQLQNSPRIGGTCTFDTTGFRSISQLFSCIEQIKFITGRGNPNNGRIAGIPLKMVLRPYRTSHHGQPTTQYGVSLEARATDAVDLPRLLHSAADEYQLALHAKPLQLEAGEPEVEAEVIEHGQPVADEVIAESPAEVVAEPGVIASLPEAPDTDAAALEAEFYGDFPEHEDEQVDAGDAVEQIQMPQRKSVSTVVKSELEHNLQQTEDQPDAPKARVIDGVTFPLQFKATAEKEKASVDLLTVLQDEATRAGINLYQYVWTEFSGKPDELTTATVKCLTEVFANKPTAKKRK